MPFKISVLTLLCAFAILPFDTFAQDLPREVVYKKDGDLDLRLKLYYPAPQAKTAQPAIVFFFGGGWVSGSPEQFEPHAKHFAALGMVGVTVDYRVRNRNGTTPFDTLDDAKAAMIYIKQHATQFGIDSSRVVASGGSAGGHLAAATDLAPYGRLAGARPSALILFNPVFNNGPGNYGYERVKDRYREI